MVQCFTLDRQSTAERRSREHPETSRKSSCGGTIIYNKTTKSDDQFLRSLDPVAQVIRKIWVDVFPPGADVVSGLLSLIPDRVV